MSACSQVYKDENADHYYGIYTVELAMINKLEILHA